MSRRPAKTLLRDAIKRLVGATKPPLSREALAIRESIRKAPKPKARPVGYVPMLTPQMCAEIKSAADVADLIAVLESWGWVDLWLTMATTPRQGRKNTSPEAARELHALGSLCLAHGYSEMPEGLRSFLASTLMGVAQGQDASTAMHVKRRAGVSLDPIDQLWWEHRVAAQVGLLVDHLLMSEPDANEVVAELLQGGIREIDAPMVKVYWKRHRDRRRALSLAPCETK